MLDLSFIINNKYFTELILKENEVLFDEWEIDNNLYIIKSWSLAIQKYTTTDKKEVKQLAILNAWAIFWEWSLKWSEPKQVKIVALDNVILYKINAKEWIKKFIREYPNEWIELLNEIIDTSNKRLLESNFLITSSFEMSKTISEINIYDNKNLFSIIDKLEKILWSRYIIYLEKNPVVNNVMTVRYDTRNKWKMQNNIIYIKDNTLDLNHIKEDWIILEQNNLIEELRNKNEIIGFLIIWEKDNNFSEWHKKAIASISVLIAWFIRQKQIYQEEKDREMNKN